MTTDKTRAIDSAGEHETGEIQVWKNRLTITHEPREHGQKRRVALQAVPRARLRYTLNASNPRDGKEYTEPFEISLEETLVRVFAEDAAVEANRDFRIPSAGNSGPVIDSARPAKLKRKMEFSGPAEVFKMLNLAKQTNAKLQSASLEIGQGDKAAVLRFGSGSVLSPESVENVIGCVRAALGDETAYVNLSVRGIEFPTGHDLTEFLGEFGINAEANEVDQ